MRTTNAACWHFETTRQFHSSGNIYIYTVWPGVYFLFLFCCALDQIRLVDKTIKKTLVGGVSICTYGIGRKKKILADVNGEFFRALVESSKSGRGRARTGRASGSEVITR